MFKTPPFKGRIHPVLEEFEDYLANLQDKQGTLGCQIDGGGPNNRVAVGFS